MARVCVIMAVYNGERYVNNSLRSILAQSLKDLELWVCDDASTDGTFSVLCRAAENDRRVRVLRNEKNEGLTSTLNRLLKLSDSEFVARQDADDLSCLGRLKKQVEYLSRHKDVAVVGASQGIIDEKGKLMDVILRAPNNEMITEQMRTLNPMCHGSVVMRRSVLDEVGGYNVGFRYAQDYELWCRLGQQGYRFANLRDVLYLWRVHGKGVAGDKIREQTECFTKIREMYWGRGDAALGGAYHTPGFIVSDMWYRWKAVLNVLRCQVHGLEVRAL